MKKIVRFVKMVIMNVGAMKFVKMIEFVVKFVVIYYVLFVSWVVCMGNLQVCFLCIWGF